MVDLIVTVFLGWLGVHKFMQKKTGLGILYLLTFGLFGIGWFIDSIIAIANYLKSRNVGSPTTAKQDYLFEVAGMPYVKDEIKKIMKKSNPEYSDFVYRVKEDFVILQPEPNNPHDHDAIAVYMNGVKIGYVPAVQTKQIKPMIGKYNFVCTITGGDKFSDDGYTDRNFKGIVRVEK